MLPLQMIMRLVEIQWVVDPLPAQCNPVKCKNVLTVCQVAKLRINELLCLNLTFAMYNLEYMKFKFFRMYGNLK